MINIIFNKKILIIGPHTDDIEIGMGGMLLGTKEFMCDISSVVLSDNTTLESNREHLAYGIHKSNMYNLNIQDKTNELLLNLITPIKFKDKYSMVKDIIIDYIKKNDPEVIFFPAKDEHLDHCLVNEIVGEVAKHVAPNLKGLIEYNIPFNQGSCQEFNWYNSFDKNTMDLKRGMIEKYSVVNGLRSSNNWSNCLDYLYVDNLNSSFVSGNYKEENGIIKNYTEKFNIRFLKS